MKSLFASVAIALSLVAGAAAAAPLSTQNPTVLASFVGEDPALRFRAQNTGGELYVGTHDLGVGTNRSEANLTYVATSTFAFAYDAITGVVTGTYGETTRTFTSTANEVFNALLISIRGPRDRTVIDNFFTLSDVIVNGTSLGNFVGAGDGQANVTTTWAVTGLSGTSFSMTGTLNYFGDAGNGSAEAAKVDFRLGNVAPVPVPAALPLMLLALGGLGLAARRRRAA